MVIYQNFLVVAAVSCGTNCDIHYLLKAFFATTMVSKVIKKHAH